MCKRVTSGDATDARYRKLQGGQRILSAFRLALNVCLYTSNVKQHPRTCLKMYKWAPIENSLCLGIKRPNEEELSDSSDSKRECPINPDLIKKEIKEDDDEAGSSEEVWLKGFGLYSDDVTQQRNPPNAADISLNAFAEAVLESNMDFQCPVDQNGTSVFDVDKPFQPSAELVPPQCFGNRKLRFQSAWYADFPWLHYIPQLKAVLCFTCGKAETMGLLGSSRRRDSVFTAVGFSNWKKAREKFGSHQKSKSHEFATWKLMHALQNQKREAALEQQRKVRQAIPNACLNKLISALRFLIHRGHTFQSHELIEESLFELLKFLGQDSEMFRYWLTTNQNFTSPEIQYELIGLMSHEIISLITKDVNQGSVYYSVIINSINNADNHQLSLCLRYLDADMQPQEEFIGFLDPMEETGTFAANLILDLLDRHSLPVDLLRGVAFESTAFSSQCYIESCALLKQKQPLAMFVHCGMPSGSILARDCSHASHIFQQTLYSVNDLCKLFSKSTKYKFLLSEMALNPASETKQLCSSEWSVNLPLINTIIQHYGLIIQGLGEMETDLGVSGVQSHFLLQVFVEGNTLVCLLIMRSIMESLNILNMNLEDQNMLMSSTLQKVRMVKEILLRVQQDASVVDFLRQAEEVVTKLNLMPITIPPLRRWYRQDLELLNHHYPETKEDFFRNEYFKVLEAAISQLESKFHQQGFIDYCHLEDVLLCAGKGGESDSVIEEKLAILSKYPEFNVRMLKVQLEMFAHKNSYSSLSEAVSLYKSVSPEVKEFFGELGKFLKFLLIIPVGTNENEQGCSPFQRLRTLLKFTTTETRSSDVAVCYVNETRLDNLCLETVAHSFVRGI
uniref:TTF-type domain-containing protein n=1 Tax=Leptobrachium leishanense TaxID=445787 RepID=A0A8C5M6D5_9ANUR